MNLSDSASFVRDVTLSRHTRLWVPGRQISGAITSYVGADQDAVTVGIGSDLTTDTDGTTGIWRNNTSANSFFGAVTGRDTTSDDKAADNHGGFIVPAGVFSFTPSRHSILLCIQLRRGTATAALPIFGHRVNNGESLLYDADANANGGGPRLIIRDSANVSVTQTYDNALINLAASTSPARHTIVIAYDSDNDVLTHSVNGTRHASTNRSLATLGDVPQTNTFGIGNFGTGDATTATQAWRFNALQFLRFDGTPSNFDLLRQHMELYPRAPITAVMAP